MGFFARIKRAFDSGGVDVALTVGKTFRWSDPILPADITFTNSADEPRNVTSVRLQLAEFDRENPVTTRKVRGRYEGTNMVVKQAFTIGAGEEHSMHVDLPLNLSGAAGEIGAEVPGWLDGLSTIVNAAKELSRDHEWYVLRVIPEVEGFTARKIASRRIRNLRTGEWGGGIVRTTINGG